jgi:methionyl-tRNA formyltransferase
MTNEPDYGVVYFRKKKMIRHPITLKEAFQFVCDLYIEMFNEFFIGVPEEIEVDYDNSSFSVWRDEQDLRIDWSLPVSKIHQKICATGYPYDGATSLYRGELIHIESSSIKSNLNIMNRASHLGKVWKIIDNRPLVICTDGILEVHTVKTVAGENIKFKYLRSRFE